MSSGGHSRILVGLSFQRQVADAALADWIMKVADLVDELEKLGTEVHAEVTVDGVKVTFADLIRPPAIEQPGESLTEYITRLLER